VNTKSFWMVVAVAVSFVIVSCGAHTTPTTFTVGGTVSGLNGTGLVLQNNATNNLTIASNGQFTFTNAIVSGGNYAVTILTQPTSPAQTCVITSGGSGTVTSDVVIVVVTCANNTFTVGGTVTGLTGKGLVLQDNGGDNFAVTGNGSFTFATAIARGSNFVATVLTQPTTPSQTCNVTNGVGTNIIGNVTDVQVTCFTTTVTYTIGGMVSGLSGTGLVLQDNSGDNLAVNKNGAFTFATPLPSGATYSVTVLAQPTGPSQNCVVAAGGGTANANITGILVSCTTNTYSIGGTITGLTGSGLVLQNNGGDNVSVSASATSFTFPTLIASGAAYGVTILTQPSSGPSCAVTNGSGTVVSSPVINIAISCGSGAANVSATVFGLPANTSVVLQNNGADNLTSVNNGVTKNFNTPIANNAAYKVSILTQPTGTTCMLGANASGTASGANINVPVTCGNPVAAGEVHTCVLTSTGGVSCWGLNNYGQLGTGNTAGSSSPVPVTGLPSGVVSVAAGSLSTCALTSTGTVWCWGDNSTGQLGNGSFTQSNIPVEVLDPSANASLNDIAQIAAGQNHACAVTNAGAALCWGDNSKGELGNGSVNGSDIPVPVSGLSSNVSTISAGSEFTCAVTTSEAAMCWGEGGAGQLGNGQAASSSNPGVVLDTTGKAPLGGVVAVSAGSEDACALTSGGAALCWGANTFGQLGEGATSAQSNIPVGTVDPTSESPLSGIVAISGGQKDFCAVTAAGAALCWGLNENGQLGTGNTSNSATPAPVSGLPGGVAAVAAGYDHSCAVTNSGTSLCWGSNENATIPSTK
jgi:large repetitive protein